MSSEIGLIVMPTPCWWRKAASGAPLGEVCSGSPESLARGMLTKGLPVNPGELPASPAIWAQVTPNPKAPGPRGMRVAPREANRPSSEEKPAAKGDRRRQATGRRAVLRFHSTDEGGEPQGSRKGRPRYPLEGRDEQVDVSAQCHRHETVELEKACEMELSRIAELARQDAGRKFYSIAHLLTKEALWEAFDNLRKDAAAGVDGVTYAEYEEHLVENLGKLHEKLKSKTYRAQPLRRIYIDKEDGRKRPISIPSLEDKIVQRATVELLNAIFEQDFLDCSYGFRPGRSAHDALDEVGRVICCGPTEYVLELDISSYFDSIVRKQLMEMVERRVSDASILRLIGKWINIGVVDDGRLLTSETGTGQGQIISPLLANIYLAPRAGCVVRGRGEAALARGSVRDPLCR